MIFLPKRARYGGSATLSKSDGMTGVATARADWFYVYVLRSTSSFDTGGGMAAATAIMIA